ncbi:MAG: triose-phosphate isomerase [Candidatus Bipolaricaulota bacterium]
MRRPLVAANWKMHKSAEEAESYLRRLLEVVPNRPPLDLVVCPSATALHVAKGVLAGSHVAWGAQSARPEPEGAFTGEVSLAQVKEHGVSYVICGHSERRALFGEDDAVVARKVKATLAAELVPILCVGESLDQRQGGKAWAVVEGQLAAALADVELGNPSMLLVAYEPVWAIGTGMAAQPEDAQDMAGRIREWLVGRFGPQGAGVRIQYGGSVKPDNARAFLGLADVDGALVGGASLDPDSFWKIAQGAVAATQR